MPFEHARKSLKHTRVFDALNIPNYPRHLQNNKLLKLLKNSLALRLLQFKRTSKQNYRTICQENQMNDVQPHSQPRLNKYKKQRR